MQKATLDLELTSRGTAMLEKFHMVENGKPVEMTTLYFLDGDQLKLTHRSKGRTFRFPPRTNCAA